MKGKEIYMYVLGAVVILGFIAVMLFLIISGKYETAINLMIGAIITMATMVVSYFYGSSKGSSDKNETIRNQSENINK